MRGNPNLQDEFVPNELRVDPLPAVVKTLHLPCVPAAAGTTFALRSRRCRHCLRLAFPPLPAAVVKTLPLPCVPAAAGGGNGTAVALRFDCRRGSKTLPLPCVPIALVAKTVSSPCGHQVDPEQVKAKFDKATSRLNVTLKVSRRRDSRCAAPPSAFSRRFDRDGEGIQQNDSLANGH